MRAIASSAGDRYRRSQIDRSPTFRFGFCIESRGSGDGPMTNIYVGNLPFNATEDDVRDLFAQHGTVDRVSLINDRETGRPRGFGFVEMSDSGHASAAISALDGADFGGRSLKVNEARPRERR